MIEKHDPVVLTVNLPDQKLAAGDLGTVVHQYPGDAAYEVEFVALDGETVAVVTLAREQVRPVAPREIAHARQLA